MPIRSVHKVIATHLTDDDGRYATIILGLNAQPIYPTVILADFATDFIGRGEGPLALLERAKLEFWESNKTNPGGDYPPYGPLSAPAAGIITSVQFAGLGIEQHPSLILVPQDMPEGMLEASGDIVSWVNMFTAGKNVESGARAAASRGTSLLSAAGELKVGEKITDNLLAWTFCCALFCCAHPDPSSVLSRGRPPSSRSRGR